MNEEDRLKDAIKTFIDLCEPEILLKIGKIFFGVEPDVVREFEATLESRIIDLTIP